MAVQNRGPQLIVPPAPVAAKTAPNIRSPYHADEFKRTPTEYKQQIQEQDQLVLNTDPKVASGWNTSQIQVQLTNIDFLRV